MKRTISLGDITIKQTDMSADGALSFRRKIELAKHLDKLGLDVIETGPIVKGLSDSLLIKSLSSSVKHSSLAVPVDVCNPESVALTWEALKDAVHPRLQLSVPVSTVQMEYLLHKKPAALLQSIGTAVSACSALCGDVEFIADDYGRCEPDFLVEAVTTAINAGAKLITLHDTAGNLLPEQLSSSIEPVRNILPKDVKLGVWVSNNLYMADSCAVAAAMAGADEIKVTACGNTTVSLKRFVNIVNVKSDEMGVVSNVSVTEIQRASSDIKFLCEEKSNRFASAFNVLPEDEKDTMLTIHDTMDDMLALTVKMGHNLSPEDAAKVYEAFLIHASRTGSVDAKELNAIVSSMAYQAPETYQLVSYVVTIGNLISATCHLKLSKGAQTIETVSMGDGPVDAAFIAIEQLLGKKYELDDFQIQSVTQGRASLGEALVSLRYNGKVFCGRGLSTDIVLSSIRAYLSAVNKIVFEED